MTTRRDLLRFGGAGVAAAAAARISPVLAATAKARPLRILILGGTGFIGPHQVRYAIARGHEVTLFNRGRHPHEWPGEVEELTGDRSTGDLKSLAGREWDACIDNPTTLPSWVRDAGNALAGRVRQYVFISTVSVYADDAKRGQDENGPTLAYRGRDALAETQESLKEDPNGLYGPLKAASEREAKARFGAATTIVRPTLIVGPGDETDRFTYWPVRLARGGETLAPGDGADPVQFIDARDLAEWTIRLAERRVFGTFNALGPQRELTMDRLLAGIATAVHAAPKLVWVPADFLAAQKISAWSDMPVWVPGQGDSAGFARRSNRAALAAGLSFRPLATTAGETLAWFRSEPAARQAKLHAGLTAERESAVLAAWHASRGR